ncbi:MAG: AAA family ATPase [Deltaproteobacteria bacterium]|jgi:ABC-type multidrug transport system ATPase subunit
MKVTRIKIDNFKSLVDFELNMAKFACLVGLNGSGKSTVLQCFDFLAQQCKGDIQTWLDTRHWSAADLNSRLSHKSNIDFTVDLIDNTGQKMDWVCSFNRKELRCTRESIAVNGRQVLKVEDGYFSVSAEGIPSPQKQIDFFYQGSILSQLKEAYLPSRLLEFKQFFLHVYALDMLSPELLRQRTRASRGGLGIGGESLSAFLHEIGFKKQAEIINKLKKAYPQLLNLDVVSLRSGWKKLHISEKYVGKVLFTEARHVSDGLLRMLAIFTQLCNDKSFILLDKIENGINPELIELLLDNLVQSPHQILVTTHSPLILNFMDDDIAQQGVVYLYKTPDGHTRAIRFFSIPSMAEKLSVMGPGEAYENTRMVELQDEINTIVEGGA